MISNSFAPDVPLATHCQPGSIRPTLSGLGEFAIYTSGKAVCLVD